jgi:hypothetical protein
MGMSDWQSAERLRQLAGKLRSDLAARLSSYLRGYAFILLAE